MRSLLDTASSRKSRFPGKDRLHCWKIRLQILHFLLNQQRRRSGEQYTVKQMEKTKKTLKAKLEKLNDQTRKDDVVTFEQLGVDRLFVDESHYYKKSFFIH